MISSLESMGLFSRGLIHNLIFAIVNWVGLYNEECILKWAYTSQLRYLNIYKASNKYFYDQPFSLIIGIVLAWNKSKISQGTVENLSKGKNHSKYFSSSSSDFIVQKINIMTFWPSLHILNKTLRCTKPKPWRKSRFFFKKGSLNTGAF